MKNYFSSDLKGAKIFIPVFLLMLFAIGYSLFTNIINSVSYYDVATVARRSSLFSRTAVVDGLYFVRLLYTIGLGICYMLIVYSLQFLIVKYTLGSLQFKGEKLDTSEMKFGGFFVRILGWTALTIITCFIYAPWFTTNIIRYFAKHTSFKGKNFRFDGSGSALFGFAVLCFILPLFAVIVMTILFMAIIPQIAIGFQGLIALVMMFVMFVLVSLLYAYIIRWVVNFEYDGKRISGSDMRYGKTMWFMLGQIMLTIITLGFYVPAFCLRLARYILRSTKMTDGDGKLVARGGYDFKVKDYWFILGQILLSIITLCIYSPWAFAAIVRRISANSFTEE